MYIREQRACHDGCRGMRAEGAVQRANDAAGWEDAWQFERVRPRHRSIRNLRALMYLENIRLQGWHVDCEEDIPTEARNFEENYVNNGNGGESGDTVTNGLERLTKVEKVVKAKTAKAEDQLGSVADSAIEYMDEGADEMRTRFEALEAKFRDGTDWLRENVRAAGGATSKQLSAHPLLAVG